MRVARKIAYNVAVSTVCKVASTVLALVSIGLITRYLGQQGFGNYATVLAFFSFFAALSDLGSYRSWPKCQKSAVCKSAVSLDRLEILCC